MNLQVPLPEKSQLHFRILTLFPEMFPGILGHSLADKAFGEGIWSLEVINIRDFAKDKHRTVDDVPFGGGAGMVMRPDVLGEALDEILARPDFGGKIYYLSPRGKLLNQSKVKEFVASESQITLICGRYEGIDQRVIDHYGIEEISVGDYVLSGGEIAAQVLMDSCIRLLKGVMGNEQTEYEESFDIAGQGLLEYPHFTRPREWKGLSVPEVLVSGNHKFIEEWRYKEALQLTQLRRPDLLDVDKT